MNTPDKCPHCGAEQEIPFNIYGWKCGTIDEVQTELCQERAAHAATKRKLEKLKDDLEWAVWNLAGCDVIAMGHSKPFDYAKEHARPALDSVSRMAQRLDAAEARVRELEGLVVTDASFRYLLPEITVRVPAGAVGRNPKTLGEAMPQQKGGQS